MNFKDLMKIVNDLVTGLETSNNYLSNLKMINDLNEVDKNRLYELSKLNRENTKKAFVLNKIVFDYIDKKHYRELNKQKKEELKNENRG